MDTDSIKFSKSEISFMLFAFILFCLCIFILFSSITFRQYFLDNDFSLGREQIGVLTKQDGGVKRSKSGEFYFEKISQSELLYTFDSIVTDSKSGATIELKDGSILQLESNTMIRLELKSQFTLSGFLNRATEVTLLTGEMTGETKNDLRVKTPNKSMVIKKNAPLPALKVNETDINKKILAVQNLENIPSVQFKENSLVNEKVTLKTFEDPIKLEIQSPALGEEIVFNAQEVIRGKEIAFKFLVNSEKLDGIFELKRENEIKTNLKIEKIFDGFKTKVNQPGNYTWNLVYQELGVEKKMEGHFSVRQKILETPVLVDFRVSQLKTNNNRQIFPIKEELAFFFRFETVEGAEKYEITLFDSDLDPPFFKADNKTPVFLANSKQINKIPNYYKMIAKLKNNFTMEMKSLESIDFEYLPPRLVLPKSGAKLFGTRVLFTWARTNFTDQYHFEITQNDPQFKNVYISQNTKENNLVLKDLPQGEYYWRVYSKSHKIWSRFSKPEQFSVK